MKKTYLTERELKNIINEVIMEEINEGKLGNFLGAAALGSSLMFSNPAMPNSPNKTDDVEVSYNKSVGKSVGDNNIMFGSHQYDFNKFKANYETIMDKYGMNGTSTVELRRVDVLNKVVLNFNGTKAGRTNLPKNEMFKQVYETVKTFYGKCEVKTSKNAIVINTVINRKYGDDQYVYYNLKIILRDNSYEIVLSGEGALGFLGEQPENAVKNMSIVYSPFNKVKEICDILK